LTVGFVIKAMLLAYFWYLCYVCFDYVKDMDPIKTFIPHEILGVDEKATKG